VRGHIRLRQRNNKGVSLCEANFTLIILLAGKIATDDLDGDCPKDTSLDSAGLGEAWVLHKPLTLPGKVFKLSKPFILGLCIRSSDKHGLSSCPAVKEEDMR